MNGPKMPKFVKNRKFLQKYVIKHIKKFGYIKKKYYLCTGFENDKSTLQKDQSFLYLK